MAQFITKLTDQTWRYAMGRRFEILTNEIFQVVRWVLVVGFANYLAHAHDLLMLTLTYWALSALLFGYIASRFLLRPEIPFLGNPEGRLARHTQSALNFLLCVVVFGVILWSVTTMTSAISDYRAIR